jgi:hypothetical protein
VETYLQHHAIPVTDLAVQGKTWFLGLVLSKVLKELHSEFSRDYFLEKIEMMTNQESTIAVYPRLTFGADQRYAAKGSYIVQLAPGPHPQLLKRSEWIGRDRAGR